MAPPLGSGSGKASRARATFLTGLLAVVPLAVTLVVTVWAFNTITALIPRLLDLIPSQLVDRLLTNRFSQFGIRVAGLLVIFMLIYLIGMIARNVVGRKLFGLLERFVLSLPMVRTIYSTIQQIGHAIMRGGGTGMFRKVVLIEYPRKGVYVIGFLTAQASEECNHRTGRELLSIFVPTTPNPTSGFLLFVPREEVTILDMSVMEGMRLVISGGAVHPPFRKEQPEGAPPAPQVAETTCDEESPSEESQ